MPRQERDFPLIQKPSMGAPRRSLAHAVAAQRVIYLYRPVRTVRHHGPRGNQHHGEGPAGDKVRAASNIQRLMRTDKDTAAQLLLKICIIGGLIC
jgi:hypothetical protein